LQAIAGYRLEKQEFMMSSSGSSRQFWRGHRFATGGMESATHQRRAKNEKGDFIDAINH
jgi:hypothetical protein